MKTVLVRYTTRDDKAAENEALIHGVFDELRRSAPAGVHYATFKLPDASSFVHFAMIDTDDGSNPLVALESFQRFQEHIDDRVVEGPVAMNLVAVDSYGFPHSKDPA